VVYLLKINEQKVYGPQSLKLHKTDKEANWGGPIIYRRPNLHSGKKWTNQSG
jgi:hypothetical protein